MAGIYIHIPFCRQACHYCNFHFATSLRQKNELVAALLKEMELQQNYLESEIIETIYFGGGTPSLLPIADLQSTIEKLSSFFTLSADAEITLEANPDDIIEENLAGWKEMGINRLSIGIQSFFEEDLLWMNRAHHANQDYQSIELVQKYGFPNSSIDLIYGTPLLTNEKWKQNVEKAIAYNIPHLSCYALTVEPKTPLHKMIRQHKVANVNADKQAGQFLLLMQWLEHAGYEHYEISNFAKAGFRSRHNSSYWCTGAGGQRKKYCGIGPSAHSFNGTSRQWNISNNNTYIESIHQGIIPFEKEELTADQQLNEYIMISLRTIEGLDITVAGETAGVRLETASKKYIENGLMTRENSFLRLTNKGKLLADGIAAALFV